MAVHGQIGVDELNESILDDEEVRRISHSTEVVDDEHYTRISVDKRWADVTPILTDGRELQSDACSPRGDPDDALSDSEISAKFQLFTESVIGTDRANEIERLSGRVDQDDFDPKSFMDLIFDAPKND
jgi:2-methylcitrate dehydratase PrpD